MKKLLFLCTGNSCRSQMAEGYGKKLLAGRWEVYSAGINPKGIHPKAIEIMEEDKIDISGQASNGLDEIPTEKLDLLITLCANANETCPTLHSKIEKVHWDLEDPDGAKGSEEEIMNKFREIRNQIREKIQHLGNES